MKENKPRYTNHLIHEKSPYLLQHAHNPVEWYPWGDIAFSKAKERDLPIFLSIGYATCHWCHVMERECFENEEVAELMNSSFINIKVDREELPEVDSLYMEFAQSMMAGAAGWPLNIILTPDLEPFFASTYLPAHNSRGLMGLNELIQRINEIWKGEEREKVVSQASKIVEVFSTTQEIQATHFPPETIPDDAAELIFNLADPVYGGIKGAPKFPIGYQISFLIQYSALKGDSRALFLAEKSLEKMHQGGIYDHLGGGFSRYSIDEKWLVPHFEKMLYDNAILSSSYIEAYRYTQKEEYKKIAVDILNYVLRDMTHRDGGFYSAEDSETEGREGLFYTWSYSQVHSLLGNDGRLFCEFYNITSEGNFNGRNILNTPLTLTEFAEKKGLRFDDLDQQFYLQRQILWKARNEREHPFKDDKIITSWNGLMIHSMAIAGHSFGNRTFKDAAIIAANFIQTSLWRGGKLYRRFREGDVQHLGVLDDYAFMIRASLTLFENGTWVQLASVCTRSFRCGKKFVSIRRWGFLFYRCLGKKSSDSKRAVFG